MFLEKAVGGQTAIIQKAMDLREKDVFLFSRVGIETKKKLDQDAKTPGNQETSRALERQKNEYSRH